MQLSLENSEWQNILTNELQQSKLVALVIDREDEFCLIFASAPRLQKVHSSKLRTYPIATQEQSEIARHSTLQLWAYR